MWQGCNPSLMISEPNIIKTCDICGTKFACPSARWHQTKRCSDACRKEAHRRNKRRYEERKKTGAPPKRVGRRHVFIPPPPGPGWQPGHINLGNGEADKDVLVWAEDLDRMMLEEMASCP